MPSPYRHLGQMETEEINQHLNKEDKTVMQSVAQVLPAITALINAIVPKLQTGASKRESVDSALKNR